MSEIPVRHLGGLVFIVVVLVVNGVNSSELCEPALKQLVDRGVASLDLIKHLPNNGSNVCGGGPCCLANMSDQLVSRGRALLHETVQREANSLLQQVTDVRDAFRNAMEEALSNAERRGVETFRLLYPRLVGHVKQPLHDLFASLRDSLSDSDKGTVERALSSFWDNLFPLVYHSTVHSRLAPFTQSYMECLRNSRRSINPWKVVPNLIGESLSKGLDTARLMMQALNVGSEVVLSAGQYEIPEECGPPGARLHFCAACHGAVVPPCSGFCLNVARGCLAPLAEIDAAWADLGSAAIRVEESIRNSGLARVLRELPDRFSDAIMVAMESGTKLQKMVRNRCGPYSHEPSEEWAAKSNEGLQNRTEVLETFESNPDSVGSLIELRASEAADVLRGSRNFWAGLAEGACEHLSAQDTNCWNGWKVASYSRPAASVGVSAQKYNPEVQVQRTDITVYALVDQMRGVKRMVTKHLTWMPESDSFKRVSSEQLEGSGSDSENGGFKNPDDEDAEDDGMGSGDGLLPGGETRGREDKLNVGSTAVSGSRISSAVWMGCSSIALMVMLKLNIINTIVH